LDPDQSGVFYRTGLDLSESIFVTGEHSRLENVKAQLGSLCADDSLKVSKDPLEIF